VQEEQLDEHRERYAKLRKVEELSPPSGISGADKSSLSARAWAFATQRRWFLLSVALPTTLAILYYGFIASDIYVSESRFVVRSTSQAAGPNMFGDLLQTVGIARSQDDTFSVHDYILSRDIVTALSDNNDLRNVLSRPEADFIRRVPPPWGGNSFEQLFKSYKTFVHVNYDTTTGISTLVVEAFRSDDAHNLASAILLYGEELINRMNERARNDSVGLARREVQENEQRVAAVQTAFTEYRLATNILDPEITAGTLLELVGELSSELAASQTMLLQMLRASPESPQIPTIRDRIAALEAQVDAERRKVIGNSDAMALQLSEYERLLLEREFATKALASATTSLETARMEADRKQLYLEEIVVPNNPDYPLYPRRLRIILLVAISALMFYGISWLVSASVREHVGR
jgi:capsular polysaccharide transport system permease protein